MKKFVVVAALAMVAMFSLAASAEMVALDAAPEAVKAAVVEKAKGAEVKEVEMKTEGEKVVYEAKATVDGAEVVIKVDAEGKEVK